MREDLMTKLDTILPTLVISNENKSKAYLTGDTALKNYQVLAFDHAEPSTRNRLGSFIIWKLYIYVDGGSLLPIDNYYKQARKLLDTLDVEITNADTGDYFDTISGKYRNSIEFKTVRGGI